MFRAKFAYETLVHANHFLVPIDFLLSCVDPRAAIPALAMLHLTRLKELKVPSTLSQLLFETVNKVIPDGHAETPFIGANCAAVLLSPAAVYSECRPSSCCFGVRKEVISLTSEHPPRSLRLFAIDAPPCRFC